MEGANYMKQMQFNCNKCNNTFILLNTFNTHMKRHRITFLWQLFQGSQLHEAKAFVELNTFQPCSKKPWGQKIRGQKLWAFSKSEIKHGFHNIISITQRMAAMNKKWKWNLQTDRNKGKNKNKMIIRLPRARTKARARAKP